MMQARCDEFLPGEVWLVGAGPGDPQLIAVRGWNVLCAADVVVHDRLGCGEIVHLIPGNIERIAVGKHPGEGGTSQTCINETLLAQARAGRRVVRLKGGDPFVFGRGLEEAAFLHRHGVRCRIVPGISSSIAAPAAAGIPVTHRGTSLGVRIATACSRRGFVVGSERNETRVFLMGVEQLEAIVGDLLAEGLPPSTPVAIVMDATTYRQRVVRGTLATILDVASREDVQPPAVIVVGEVVNLPEVLAAPGERIFVVSSRIPPSLLAANPQAVFVHRPLFRDVPMEDCDPSQMAASLDADWLLFLHPLGVKHYFSQLRTLGVDLRRLRMRIAALGGETSSRLEEHGIHPDLLLTHRDDLVLAANRGGLVCVPGEESEELPEFLAGNVGCVALPVYRSKQTCPGEIDWSFIDAVSFSSRRLVLQFLRVFPEAPVHRLRAWCVGASSARAARRAGFCTVAPLAADPSEGELLRAG